MMSLIRLDVLDELADEARRAPVGDFVEVGVYQGGSAFVLGQVARKQKRRLFLFDTFSGMPHAEPGDAHAIGDFADTSLEKVQAAIPDAICIAGVFPETLPDDLWPIALAHIDCDQYASVRACCERLADRMAPGGVMVFDDYDVLTAARRAVDEIFSGRVTFSNCGKARVRF